MNPENSKVGRVAIYPGSFDPITCGHVDLIWRALSTFDKVVVLVARSGKKTPLFDATERQQMIQKCFEGEPRVAVEVYAGLVVDYAKQNNINVVLRGLRVVSDFDYEFQMATMNRRMYPGLQNFFLMASEEFFFVNSSLVKEVVSHHGDAKNLLPPHVEEKLRKRLCCKC